MTDTPTSVMLVGVSMYSSSKLVDKSIAARIDLRIVGVQSTIRKTLPFP